MKQEDKDLLLKDICARLPYNVKCCIYNFYRDEYEDETITISNLSELIDTFSICEIKPYLFPMSSMTEEQCEELKREYCNIACDNIKKMFENPDETHLYSSKSSSFEIDWFHRYHIDYRGLIPKGLAKDATGLNIY